MELQLPFLLLLLLFLLLLLLLLLLLSRCLPEEYLHIFKTSPQAGSPFGMFTLTPQGLEHQEKWEGMENS